MSTRRLDNMRYSITIITLLCCGCAQTAQQEALDALRSDLQTLQTSVSDSQTELVGMQATKRADQGYIELQITELDHSIGELSKTVRSTCQQIPITIDSECIEQPRPVLMDAGDKMVLGEVERVWIVPPGLSVIARMDTGASSSSLHADNITTFERDGEDWVRFDIGNDDSSVTIERAIKKYVRVFQQADKVGSRRPVVDIRLFLGDVKDTFSFTLADRSHLEHDMILGRNFLTDIALVDVAKQFVQPGYVPAETQASPQE
jgi:hypothetical protein